MYLNLLKCICALLKTNHQFQENHHSALFTFDAGYYGIMVLRALSLRDRDFRRSDKCFWNSRIPKPAIEKHGMKGGASGGANLNESRQDCETPGALQLFRIQRDYMKKAVPYFLR